jgi:hypothetical protein
VQQLLNQQLHLARQPTAVAVLLATLCAGVTPVAAAAAASAGLYNTYAVEAGAPTFVLSKSALDVTAFAVSLLLVFRWVPIT